MPGKTHRPGRVLAVQRTGWLTDGAVRLPDRRLLRRNRLVPLMKVLLPIVVLALITLVIAWPQLYRSTQGASVVFRSIEVADDKLRMKQARYQGIDRRGRPFVVTADQTVQDIGERSIARLEVLQADLALTDGSWVTVKADTGIYSEQTQTLKLSGNVSLFSDRGYEFHGETADIDLKGGLVSSEDPVNGQSGFGNIEGNTFWLSQNGDRIRFENGVKMTIYPGAEG